MGMSILNACLAVWLARLCTTSLTDRSDWERQTAHRSSLQHQLNRQGFQYVEGTLIEIFDRTDVGSINVRFVAE